MSGMSTVWEDTNGCVKQYRFAFDICLITGLSSLSGIIMYFSIDAPGHGNKYVDGINEIYKFYLKSKIERIGKLACKNTSKIVILPSASKEKSLNFYISVYMFSIINKD